MHLHEALARGLRDIDVEVMFGLLGDANLFLADSFVRSAGGRWVALTHEAAAVEAAVGYWQTSGRLGVATVTHGPALTNAVTALVEAVRSGAELLLIAGDTAVVDEDNLQNVAQREVVAVTGAGFQQLRSAETWAVDLASAVRRVHAERRPVVLNVPADLMWTTASHGSSHVTVARQAVRPAAAALEAAAGLVASARRPVVLAGRGAADDHGRAALVRLAARLGAPLMTTLRAKGLFAGEPHDLGVLGTLSHSVALDAAGRSDCVLAFGASLNRWTTLDGSLLRTSRVVQVDTDPARIGRWVQPDAAVVGDAAAVADALVALLDELTAEPTGFAAEVRAAPATAEDEPPQEVLDLRTALRHLERLLPRPRTVVFDGGRFVVSAFSLLSSTDARGFVHTVSFGSIGLGLGTAIGAAVGAPHRPTILVAGDGGFMMSGLAELTSAVRLGLDLVVVVLNDGAYGAEHVQLVRRGLDPEISTFDWPDLGPVAEALGVEGHTVRDLDALDRALACVEKRTRPLLIDIRLDAAHESAATP